MQMFQKAVNLVKRAEAFGLWVKFTAAGWYVYKDDKPLLQGGELNLLQYFVEGMEYGNTDKTEDVEEGGRGEPLFVELEGEEPDPALLYARVDAAKADAEKWRKRYERIRSRLRRAQSKKVWLAICPTDYSHAVVTVGATRNAASEAMMYTLDSNEDVERVYFEQQDVEPEREAQVAKKKKATSKKKRRK